MDKIKEYELLMKLELETTRIRHTTFTALLSISFLLPGLALEQNSNSTIIQFLNIEISRAVFLLGYIFYCFAVFHYFWYHRYSHFYRKALKIMEESLNINIYKNRVRPKKGRFKMHFDWALYIIGLAYGFIVAVYVGFLPFVVSISFIVVAYLVLFFLSAKQPDEPLES